MESTQSTPPAEATLINEVSTVLTVTEGRAGRILDEADQAHARLGLEMIDVAVMRAHVCLTDYFTCQDHEIDEANLRQDQQKRDG